MNYLPTLVAGLLLLPVCLIAAKPAYYMTSDQDEMRIVVKHKLILVTAEIDGRSGFFLLDTGASRLFLNERIFKSRDKIRTEVVTDVNGVRRKVGDVFVKGFRWGSLERKNFLAKSIDMRVAEKVMGKEIMGLIGYEVLRDIELHIDYDERRLRLFRLDRRGTPVIATSKPADHHVPFFLCRHLPVIKADIGETGKTARLGVDSGASLNVLNISWKKKVDEVALRRYQISYNAALSQRRVDYYTLPSLHIGNELALIHSKVAFVDLRKLRKNLLFVDGLLSVNLFRLGVVSINYQKKEFRLWVRDNVFAMKYRPLNTGP